MNNVFAQKHGGKMAGQFQHQYRTPNIGEQLRDGVVKPIMSIVVIQGTQMVLSRMVDGVFRDRIGEKQEDLSNSYRDVSKITLGEYTHENKNGTIKSDEMPSHTSQTLQTSQMSQTSQENLPAVQIDDELKTALEHLERATENNTCTVCKPKLDDAKKYVENRTKEIIRAGKINKAMERLQLTGEIPQKPWRDLTKEEKNFIRERT